MSDGDSIRRHWQLPDSGTTVLSETHGARLVTLPRPDRRPPMAIAMQWVSEIITIAIMQVMPLLMGWGLDNYFQTRFVFVGLGALLGLGMSMQRILSIVKQSAERDQANKTNRDKLDNQ